MPSNQTVVSLDSLHIPHSSHGRPWSSEKQTREGRRSTSTNATAFTSNTGFTTSTAITSPSDVESGPRSPALSQTSHSSLRPHTSHSPHAQSSTMSSVAQPAKTKKKPSFLGTLFTKEPSTDAFLRMQHQSRKQLAQSPRRVNPPGMSGVSSAKIPEHVPKVNSKWDGMPRKTKDEDESSTSQSTHSRNDSIVTSSSRSRSADPSNRRRRSRRFSGSTTGSHGTSQTRPVTGVVQSGTQDASSKVSPQSISTGNRPKHPRSKTTHSHTQTPRSSSSSSGLPRITSFFPHEIPDPPGVRQLYGGSARSPACDQDSTEGRAARGGPSVNRPLIEDLPHQTAFADANPLEQLTLTSMREINSLKPLGQSDVKIDHSLLAFAAGVRANEGVFRASGSDAFEPPMVHRKSSHESARAFLAGEARPFQLPKDADTSSRTTSMLRQNVQSQLFGPGLVVQQDLENRPDSSRERLGLRASFVKVEDALPWEPVQPRLERRPVPSKERLGLRASVLQADKAVCEAQVGQDLQERPVSSRERLGLSASLIKTADTVPWELETKEQPHPVAPNRAFVSKTLRPRSLSLFNKA